MMKLKEMLGYLRSRKSRIRFLEAFPWNREIVSATQSSRYLPDLLSSVPALQNAG